MATPVPAEQTSSVGPAWANGETGTSIPIQRFFIATPSTPVWEINFALLRGDDLALTPGVYNLDAPIVVSRPGTVVLGLGFATLVPQHGNAALVVLPDNGVKVTGLLIDAGPVNSRVLMSVGTPGHAFGRSFGRQGVADDPGGAPSPDLVSDVFFRVGGAETPAHASISFLDNADNSIIDDMWAWRADHGVTAGSTGWTVNTGDTGVMVTGNNVTAYGLAVEHYQKNEVVWSGQGGTDIFFQNELPYDPPTQAAWMASPTQDGYPAFLVTNNVKTFQGYGMASYAVFIDTPATINDAMSYQSPVTPGDQFHDILALYISSNNGGGIQSVINGTGGSATTANADTPVDVGSYP